MKIVICILICVIITEACHFGGKHSEDEVGDEVIEIEIDASRRRRRRSTEADDRLTVNLRTYFRDCMLSKLGDTLHWRSVVDFTVLDTLWFQYAADTACSRSTNNDDKECWKQCLDVLLRKNSTLLIPAKECVDAYQLDTSNDKIIFSSGAYREVEQKVETEVGPEEYVQCVEGELVQPDAVNSVVQFVINDAFCSICDYGVIPGTNERPSFAENNANYITTGQLTEDDLIIRWPYRFEALTRRDSPFRNATKICNEDFYPVFKDEPKLGWGQWREWGTCNATCSANGSRSRIRVCLDKTSGLCVGLDTETEICTISNCPTWTQWSDWSGCSNDCGPGLQWSHRECQNGQAGVDPCTGDYRRIRECTNSPCEPNWSDWLSCSVTCGTGNQQRIDMNHPQGVIGGVEMRPCVLNPCAATWGEWEGWTTCTYKVSRRRCKGGDGICEGKDIMVQQCNGANCPSNDGGNVITMTPWGPWTQCDTQCGTGRKFRKRQCVINDMRYDDPTFCGKLTSESKPCRVLCVHPHIPYFIRPQCRNDPRWSRHCNSSNLRCSRELDSKHCTRSCNRC